MKTTLFFILLALFLASCVPAGTAPKKSALTYSPNNPATKVIVGDARFIAAYNIINNKCSSCHQHDFFKTLTTEDSWIKNGYVVKGNSTNSLLIKKMSLAMQDGNMPPLGAPQVSASEFQILKQWIDQISSTATPPTTTPPASTVTKANLSLISNTMTANKMSGSILIQYSLSKALERDLILTLMPTTRSTLTSSDYSISANTIKAGSINGSINVTLSAAAINKVSEILEFSVSTSDTNITFVGSNKFEILIQNAPVVKPDFKLLSSTVTVNKLSAPISISYSLSKAQDHDVVIKLTPATRSTLQPSEYAVTLNTIKAGSISGSLSITLTSAAITKVDEVLELNASLDDANINIASSPKFEILVKNPVVVVYEKPEFKLLSNAITVNKLSGKVSIPYSLSSASTKNVVINLTPTASSTLIASDYTITTNTIAAGAINGNISITLTAAALAKLNGTLELTATLNDAEVSAVGNTKFTITIKNAEFKLITNATTVNKLSAAISIQYSLSSAQDHDITIVLTRNASSTLISSDYIVGSDTIKAGAISGAATVTINPTALAKLDESLKFTLSLNDSSIIIGGVASFDIAIKNVPEVMRTAAEIRYDDAKKIIDTKCTSCHTHLTTFGLLVKETDWIANNYYIKPGNATGSVLLTKTIQQGGNMPPSGAPLTSGEYDTIKAWINGIALNLPILTFSNSTYNLPNSTTSLSIPFTLSKAAAADLSLTVVVDNSSTLTENTYYTINKTIAVAKGVTTGAIVVNFKNGASITSTKTLNLSFAANSNVTLSGNAIKINMLGSNDDTVLSDGSISSPVGNEDFIYNKLNYLFYSASSTLGSVKNEIINYGEVFGQKCDPFEDPFHELSMKFCEANRLYALDFTGKPIAYKVIRQQEYEATRSLTVVPSSATRQSHIINLCEGIVNTASSITQCLSRAGLASNAAVNAANINAVYKTFNPGYDLTTDENTKILASFTTWKDIIRLYCIDPKWQSP